MDGKNRRTALIRTVIAVTACAMMLYGLWRGEAETVLQKAVYICFECIGLG